VFAGSSDCAMSQTQTAPTPGADSRRAATDEFLARFYRQMGLYAIAAALNVPLDPAAPAREDRAMPGPQARKAA
jgi:hypothetical protein